MNVCVSIAKFLTITQHVSIYIAKISRYTYMRVSTLFQINYKWILIAIERHFKDNQYTTETLE